MGGESGSDTGSDAGAVRRRRLKFRCWHRGMKEVDLLLGPFADAAADRLDTAHLDQFDALLELPDPDILSWVMGEAAGAG